MCNLSESIYQEGIQIGERSGRSNEKADTIRRMYNKNKPLEDIMDATGLTKEQINEVIQTF